MVDDGHFLSGATILLGLCLLVIVPVTVFLVYLLATKRDQEIRAASEAAQENKEN